MAFAHAWQQNRTTIGLFCKQFRLRDSLNYEERNMASRQAWYHEHLSLLSGAHEIENMGIWNVDWASESNSNESEAGVQLWLLKFVYYLLRYVILLASFSHLLLARLLTFILFALLRWCLVLLQAIPVLHWMKNSVILITIILNFLGIFLANSVTRFKLLLSFACVSFIKAAKNRGKVFCSFQVWVGA